MARSGFGVASRWMARGGMGVQSEGLLLAFIVGSAVAGCLGGSVGNGSSSLRGYCSRLEWTPELHAPAWTARGGFHSP
jgi:hypothetical protein